MLECNRVDLEPGRYLSQRADVKNPNRFYFAFKLNGVKRQFQFSASRYEQLVIRIVSSSRSAASISKKWRG